VRALLASLRFPTEVPEWRPVRGANAMRDAGFRDVRSVDWGEALTLEAPGC
jgi:hypothetical protein